MTGQELRGMLKRQTLERVSKHWKLWIAARPELCSPTSHNNVLMQRSLVHASYDLNV